MLKEWVQENITSILSCEKEEELLSVLTEKIIDFSNNREMRKLSIENLNFISQLWIKGDSYFQILRSCNEKSIRIEKRGKSKPIDMSDIISICDNGLGYETSIILNAINNNLFLFSFDKHFSLMSDLFGLKMFMDGKNST